MAEYHAELPSLEQVRALRAARRTVSATVAVRHAAAEIYPYLTQVDLYNRASGASAVTYEMAAGLHGATLFRATARKAGATMRYVELPYEWQQPIFVQGELFFDNGPFRYGRIRAEYLEAQRAVRYDFDYTPRHRLSFAGVLARLLLWRYVKILRGIDAQLPAQLVDPMGAAGFADRSPAVLRQAQALARSWTPLAPDPVVAETFAELVLTAPDTVVGRMRPYVVARQLGTERQETLQFCLKAAEAGHLDLRWDLVCPSCGGAKRRAPTLAELGTDAHCEVCNIRYDADLARNVEVSFRPARAVRPVDDHEYCLQSPSHQRQILAQANVEPRTTVQLSLRLTPGHYRLRCIGRPGEMLFDSAYGRGRQSVAADVTRDLDGSSVECGGMLALQVRNDSDGWRTVRFEHHAYREDAATAADIAAMPQARHLVGDLGAVLAQSTADSGERAGAAGMRADSTSAVT